MSDGSATTGIDDSTAGTAGPAVEVSDGIDDTAPERATADSTDREQAPWTRGASVWVVLGILGLSMLVVPWALVFLPAARTTVGLVGFSFRDAYLVIPLVPAIGLGLVGIWTALQSHRR